jgi:predicted transposase/invertase (TIGR01784 family)
MNNLTVVPFKNDWKEKEGALGFKMRNDYLFRAFLQCDNESLKALIASLLYVDVSEITSAEITNPIILGASADDKEIRMDIHVILNKQHPINIEMQTYNRAGWKERSVLYACRGYDSQKHGDSYEEHPGFRQVTFCDYTLFAEHPAFCSTYMLTSTDDPHYIYSDKISLTNIDMTRIDLASENDIRFGLVNWAKLFMAETWEDFKMLEEENKTTKEDYSSPWRMTDEEIMLERMRNIEEGKQMWASMEKKLEEYKKEAEENKRIICELEEHKKQIDEERKRIDEIYKISRELEEYEKRGKEDKEKIRELKERVAALEK